MVSCRSISRLVLAVLAAAVLAVVAERKRKKEEEMVLRVHRLKRGRNERFRVLERVQQKRRLVVEVLLAQSRLVFREMSSTGEKVENVLSREKRKDQEKKKQKRWVWFFVWAQHVCSLFLFLSDSRLQQAERKEAKTLCLV